MVYSIEELGQVRIYGNAVAFSDDFPNLLHRIMGRPPGAKAEARIRKTRIKDRRQLLGSGLLDQSVQDRGDAERAGPARRFWNLHPTDRCRTVPHGSALAFG